MAFSPYKRTKNVIQGKCFCFAFNGFSKSSVEHLVHRGSPCSCDSHLMSPFALLRIFKLLLPGSTGSKKSKWSDLNVIEWLFSHLPSFFFFWRSSISLPSVFWGLFTRWISETDSTDLGHIQVIPGQEKKNCDTPQKNLVDHILKCLNDVTKHNFDSLRAQISCFT